MSRAVSVRLDDEVQRALNTLEASGMSRSEAIRKAILDAAWAVVEGERQRLQKLSPTGTVPFEFDYISLADPHEMDEIEGEVDPNVGAILSTAVKMLPVEEPRNDEERAQKPVRLIDNIVLRPVKSRYPLSATNPESGT